MNFCIRCQLGHVTISTSLISFTLIYSVLSLWTGVEGWSYHYSNTTMKWAEARNWCQQHYTDMVAIQDQGEIAHLNNILPRKASGPGSEYYWIGIRRVEGVWTWVGTNKALTAEAENWAAGEPNNGGNHEDCVEMYIKRQKDNTKWNDESCKKMKRPLCYTASCANDSCSHGECVETINSHKCECFKGFYGEKCEHVVQCKEEEVMVVAKASLDCSHPNGNYSYDSLCEYSCEDGYQLSGSGTMRCMASGLWSEQPPTCELITCSELLSLEKGSIDCQHPLGSFSYSSTCGFTCEEGFTLIDSSSASLHCEASGLWNNYLPQCAAVQCSVLRAPENGTVTCGGDPEMDFSYGHSCSFSCAEGFRLQGASVLTCTAAAEWNEELPHCEAVRCPLLQAPADGAIDCSNDELDRLMLGTQCSFTCDQGYTLHGHEHVTCYHHGNWTGEAPKCQASPRVDALLSPTNIGLAAGGAVSLSGLSIALWLLKRFRNQGNKFDLNSFSDIEEPPQVYKSSIDSLI